MNVDKVQTKMCRRLQGTVGFVGAFWHREEFISLHDGTTSPSALVIGKLTIFFYRDFFITHVFGKWALK